MIGPGPKPEHTGGLVLMTGSSAWTESDHRDPDARQHCPSGCRRRDLKDERERGMNRLCLRCFTWTFDPPAWRAQSRPGGPLAKAATAALDRQQRAEMAEKIAREEAERKAREEAEKVAAQSSPAA